MAADNPVVDRIADQAAAVQVSPAFAEFRHGHTLSNGDLALVNNSFLYREAVATIKSPYYLALPIEEGAAIGPPGVVEFGAMNTDFKQIAQSADNHPDLVPLDAAVGDQLESIGSVVFSLIGPIDEGEAVEVGLAPPYSALRYDPNAQARVEGDGDALVINTLTEPEDTLKAVAELVEEAGEAEALTRLAPAFAKAIEELREKAPRRIRLDGVEAAAAEDGLLDRIVTTIEEQVAEYRQALDDAGPNLENRDARNTILRISYNFAGDASDLLKLFVSVCDLKPIVLWLTVADHLETAQAFRRLPFGLETTKKPSLAAYHEIVGGARNRVFHDFFAFDRPFEVDLSGVALQARRLLLFHAHKRSPADAFDYEDRQLVELLRQFTRAPERSVSVEFWQRNLDVLTATAALTAAMRDALRLLARTRS